MQYTEIKILKAKTLKPYWLELEFNDGTTRKVDLEPVLYGNLFGPLRNTELFKRVRVNREIQTIEWPNGADFHPETLYNWEDYKNELAENAQKWQHSKTG